jgi:Ca-activated chloride channel family protein
VRIHVVGLGTVDGPVGAADGLAIYMQLDEPTLREVARMTGGEYHHAGTAEELRSVYQGLGSRLQVETRQTEIAPVLALLAAIVVLAAVTLSLRWFGRPL